MKDKIITVKLDDETHRHLKSQAVLASEKLPDFARKVIAKALKDKKLFSIWGIKKITSICHSEVGCGWFVGDRRTHI